MHRSSLAVVHLLVAAASGCVLRAPDPLPSAQPPALELRIADRLPHAGWLLFQAPGEATQLYLDPRAVATARDLAAVGAAATGDGLRLDLWLTGAGAERLAAATGENVGRWLAVVANGQVRSVAPIAQSVTAGVTPVQVALRLNDVEARRLQEQIEAAWPPSPR